jgi:serine protease Do
MHIARNVGGCCVAWAATLAAAWLLGAPGPLRGQADLGEQEEAALRAAVARVAPSVVRIETVGGLEVVGQVTFGTGPTTGLVVSEDGYIISSAFNFAQKPASILVGLADGSRTPARLVATDHSRKLVLLKVEGVEKLPVPEIVPLSEIRVGQWAMALGRTFDGELPYTSLGIVSAVNRIYGRAIQTDCKVSPSNYGGPLIDIRGRVLGVLVPMSPQGSSDLAGVEWYDSGIGFAVPMEHVAQALPRLRQGENLHPGVLGVNLRPGHVFADPAVVAAVRANSPAARAGIRQGDTLVEIDGKPIVRQMQVREALGPRYAGETVRVVVKRGDQRLEFDVLLVEKLEPYARPFLGLLPLREPRGGEADQQGQPPARPAGVVVRYVYDNSPADVAGIAAGDRIVALGDKPIADRAALREAASALDGRAEAKLVLLRDDKAFELTLRAADQPEAVPARLPPAMLPRKPYLGQQPPVGRQELKIAEFSNECVYYVPTNYDPAVPHALLVWLHEPGGLSKPEQIDAFIQRWKDVCEASDLILVVPRSQDPDKWVANADSPFIAKAIEHIRNTYTVDETRIATAGYKGGGSFAFVVAYNLRDVVRGVAAVDAAPAGQPPEHDPGYPLAFLITTADKGGNPQQLEAAIKRLRDMKYPVTEVPQGETPRDLNAAELQLLVRWLDTLDRI